VIHFAKDEDKCNIIVREKEPYHNKKYSRRFVISISYLKNSYSIKSFEIQSNKRKEEYKKIHSLKVEGDNSVDSVIKDLEEIIQGKLNDLPQANYPF